MLTIPAIQKTPIGAAQHPAQPYRQTATGGAIKARKRLFTILSLLAQDTKLR